jgi:hypothetical protein
MNSIKADTVVNKKNELLGGSANSQISHVGRSLGFLSNDGKVTAPARGANRGWVASVAGGFDMLEGAMLYSDPTSSRGYTIGDIITLKKVAGNNVVNARNLIKMNRDPGDLPEPERKVDYRSTPGASALGVFAATETNVGFHVLSAESEAFKWEFEVDQNPETQLLPYTAPVLSTIVKRAEADENFLIESHVLKMEIQQDPSGVLLQFMSGVYQKETIHRLIFTNSFSSREPDIGIFKSAKAVIAAQPRNAHAALASYGKLIEASQKYVFGTGTLSGAVGRFLTGGLVRKESKIRTPKFSLAKALGKNRTPIKVKDREPDITEIDAINLLRKRVPLATKPRGLTLNSNNMWDLYLRNGSVALPNGSFNEPMRVNKTASSGNVWGSLKKSDTLEYDMNLSSALLDELQALATEDGKLDTQRYIEWFAKNKGRLIPVMKAKPEIGERDKVETKWRLYGVFNNYVQIPLSMFLANVFSNENGILYKTETNTSWSLLGWSQYHGGLQELMLCMVREVNKKGFSIAVYSDNLWILFRDTTGEMIWMSLDGSSMECSITKRDFGFLMEYVRRVYWNSTPMTLGMQFYLEQLMPDLVINGLTVLEKTQLINIGQFSGTFGTAYLNTIKMVQSVAGLEKLLLDLVTRDGQNRVCLKSWYPTIPPVGQSVIPQDQKLPAKFDKCFSGLGVVIKVELVTNSLLFDWISGSGRAPKERVVMLDLLATDAKVIPDMGIIGGIYPIFPVLAEKRLYKALTYNKLVYRESGKGTVSSAMQRLHIAERARLKSLYLLGGWADEGLAPIIRNQISYDDGAIGVSFGKEKGDAKDFEYYQDIVESAIAETETGEDTASLLATYVSTISIPSMYDVMGVCYSESYASMVLVAILFESKNKGLEDVIRFSSLPIVVDLLTSLLETEEIEDIITPEIRSEFTSLSEKLSEEMMESFAELKTVTERIKAFEFDPVDLRKLKNNLSQNARLVRIPGRKLNVKEGPQPEHAPIITIDALRKLSTRDRTSLMQGIPIYEKTGWRRFMTVSSNPSPIVLGLVDRILEGLRTKRVTPEDLREVWEGNYVPLLRMANISQETRKTLKGRDLTDFYGYIDAIAAFHRRGVTEVWPDSTVAMARDLKKEREDRQEKKLRSLNPKNKPVLGRSKSSGHLLKGAKDKGKFPSKTPKVTAPQVLTKDMTPEEVQEMRLERKTKQKAEKEKHRAEQLDVRLEQAKHPKLIIEKETSPTETEEEPTYKDKRTLAQVLRVAYQLVPSTGGAKTISMQQAQRYASKQDAASFLSMKEEMIPVLEAMAGWLRRSTLVANLPVESKQVMRATAVFIISSTKMTLADIGIQIKKTLEGEALEQVKLKSKQSKKAKEAAKEIARAKEKAQMDAKTSKRAEKKAERTSLAEIAEREAKEKAAKEEDERVIFHATRDMALRSLGVKGELTWEEDRPVEVPILPPAYAGNDILKGHRLVKPPPLRKGTVGSKPITSPKSSTTDDYGEDDWA